MSGILNGIEKLRRPRHRVPNLGWPTLGAEKSPFGDVEVRANASQWKHNSYIHRVGNLMEMIMSRNWLKRSFL